MSPRNERSKEGRKESDVNPQSCPDIRRNKYILLAQTQLSISIFFSFPPIPSTDGQPTHNPRLTSLIHLHHSRSHHSNMSASAQTYPTPRRSQVPTCPLNEAGMEHSCGLYLNNGRSQTRTSISILFGDSNPPGFIWDASEQRQTAMEKIRKGENVEENRRVAEETAGLVGRFVSLHAGIRGV